MIKQKFCLFLIAFVLMFACSEPPPPSFSLEERQLVDSLYQIEYELIVDSLDADCEQLQITQLKPLIDSLLKVRMAEVIRQKQRYQQQKQEVQ